MANYALINKEVIPYICARRKITKEYLSKSSKFDLDKIERWLDIKDTALPTINQAKKLAACIHIPFAALYMNTSDINVNAIPSIKNFRTFSGSVFIDDSSLNLAICDVLLERDFLIDKSQELSVFIPRFIVNTIFSNDPIEWARSIRSQFNINIEDQISCKSARQLYLYLRSKIEKHGVFVQCFSGVPVDVVRGFSIFYTSLPIIGLNFEDRPPAKSFSLIHELVHLIKRESTVCNEIIRMDSSPEEVFCNAVAGELLVPNSELLIRLSKRNNLSVSIETIKNLAKEFSVSREVIVRRLLDIDVITISEFDAYSLMFKEEFEKEREEKEEEKEAGLVSQFHRDVCRETIDRTSPTLIKALLEGYYEDLFNKRDIACHLGIAQKHIGKLFSEISKWNN